MAEPHPGAELGQASLGRGAAASVPIPSWAAARQTSAGRRSGRPPPAAAAAGSGREGADAAPEVLLDAARQRHRAREPEPARQLRRRQTPGQLQQGQRVTARLGDDLVADPRVDRPGQHRVQQRARIGLRQPADRQLRQPGQVAARVPGGENQAD